MDYKTDPERAYPRAPFRKARFIYGQNIDFRNAGVEDAAFILRLRTNENRNRHIGRTRNDLADQIDYLEKYKRSNNSNYFIIQEKTEKAIGTVRLYDRKNDSFCWGSWILSPDAPTHAGIESCLIVYTFAVNYLGFQNSHFDVRKQNKSVRRFHERFGARCVKETEVDVFYEIGTKEIRGSIEMYKKFLPRGIQVVW